jgi:fucose permease
MGLGWRTLFLVYLVVAVLTCIWLAATPIKEERAANAASGFKDCFGLLGTPFILLCFVGIVCHVGIDVGTNTTAPKILMERLHLSLDEAGGATGIYFLFRTAGCFLGAFLLQRIAARPFFLVSVGLILAAFIALFQASSPTMLYVCIALIGLGNSNVFSVIFSQALLALPQKKNEISGLMITAVFGGALFPPLMGIASDHVGQVGAVAVMSIGALYLLFYTSRIRS